MHIAALTSLLLSTALAATPKTAAPKATLAAPRAVATEIQLEVVERRGAKPSSFGFVVPLEGKVQAWIDRGDDPRHCEVEVHPAHEGLRVELKCVGSREHELRVEAVRSLVLGRRTRIAEVTQPGGATSQVFVTLQ